MKNREVLSRLLTTLICYAGGGLMILCGTAIAVPLVKRTFID